MSRILFKILKFWKRSHASWITSIYSDFSKIWCWKISFICVTTSFLDMLKLEKTVHLENTDSSSKIQVHSPLCSIKIYPDIDYFAPREIIRFRTMRRNQFLQNQLTHKALKFDIQSQIHARNKKFSKRRTSGNIKTE